MDDAKIWLHDLLKSGFDDIDPQYSTGHIKLPLNIGCPNANPPRLNVLTASALRMYFGSCIESGKGEDITTKKHLTLVGYGVGSAASTVGTVPDLIKSYPIEMVPCLKKLLDAMNTVLRKHLHTNSSQLQQEPFNHIELKVYFGPDIFCGDDVDGSIQHLSSNDPPMREVGWHCDWSVGQVNSQMDKSYVFSLSLGEARTVTYRRQEKTRSGGWTNCRPLSKHTFHHRLDHGSLNILDHEDEDGEGGTRFQHRGFFGRNTETEVVGKGISAVLVFRTCPPENLVQVNGPSSKKPFAKVCSEEELVRFNQRMDGKPKKFMGTGKRVDVNDSVYWYNQCYNEINQHRTNITQWLSNTIQPKIVKYLQESNIWVKRNTLVEE